MPGRALCPGCLAVKQMKRAPTAVEVEAARDAKRRRLLARLDLIEEARRAVLGALDRVNGDAA